MHSKPSEALHVLPIPLHRLGMHTRQRESTGAETTDICAILELNRAINKDLPEVKLDNLKIKKIQIHKYINGKSSFP